MDELLAALIGLLLEVVLELAGEALLDLASRGAALVLASLIKTEGRDPWLAAAGYGVLGALAGALSIAVFPHPLVHRERPSRFHGVSLLVSPIITGVAMSSIGSLLRRSGRKVVPIESFWLGFTFAFVMALVRFLFSK